MYTTQNEELFKAPSFLFMNLFFLQRTFFEDNKRIWVKIMIHLTY